jgi:hypothetical protein
MIITKKAPLSFAQRLKEQFSIVASQDKYMQKSIQRVSPLAGSVLSKRSDYKKSLLIEASKCPSGTTINRLFDDNSIVIKE